MRSPIRLAGMFWLIGQGGKEAVLPEQWGEEPILNILAVSFEQGRELFSGERLPGTETAGDVLKGAGVHPCFESAEQGNQIWGEVWRCG